jgi:transcriptional regulator with XRE-family HTH domain
MPRRPLIDTASVEVDGYKLRNLRKLQGHTLESLAAKVEISFGFLSQIERGNRNVGPVVFSRICDALDLADRASLLSPAARRRLAAANKVAA